MTKKERVALNKILKNRTTMTQFILEAIAKNPQLLSGEPEWWKPCSKEYYRAINFPASMSLGVIPAIKVLRQYEDCDILAAKKIIDLAIDCNWNFEAYSEAKKQPAKTQR